MVGVTSTEKTFAVDFAFMECEKEDNFRWALEVCRSLLKKHVEMPKAIVTERDPALMNAVAKVFTSSDVLLCRYHISCSVRSKVKPVVGTKQVATEGGKVVKPGVIVDQILNASARSSTKELYADSVLQFWKICEKYPDLLKYIENIILDKVKEKFVCAWTDKGDLCKAWDTINHMISNQHNEIQTSFGRSITVLEHRFKNKILYSQLIGNVSRAGLNYIFHEANRGKIIGGKSANCGCTIIIMYGLPCACAIAKKVRLGESITVNEITLHWKRLSFDDDGCVKEYLNISIISELEAIQERFSKADDNTKLYIKEQLRRIGFPETTDMKPSSQPVKTKGATKKVKSTPNDNSTTWSPSYCEHVDKLFPDSPTPKSQKSQKSSNKGACLSKPPPTPIPP
ncbi:uncharacterized protein LOC131623212 [Vicia villosa]|uniref:uncharacterized protein LOC131623212 n=1 Tax=Vicia villosa TaxID=3911 RepID=UPI00273AC197|nr:uncharacterized protein LOC131623212 [Vicia villosa]